MCSKIVAQRRWANILRGGGGWLEVEGVAGDSAFVDEEPVFGVDASGEPSE